MLTPPLHAQVSWTFGQRLRAAGLLAPLGSIGDALDNALATRPRCRRPRRAESFFASLQTELLDRRTWSTPP